MCVYIYIYIYTCVYIYLSQRPNSSCMITKRISIMCIFTISGFIIVIIIIIVLLLLLIIITYPRPPNPDARLSFVF